MTKIKGVVFDLDHTLFDRYGTFKALQEEFYNELKEYLSEGISPRDISEALCEGDKKYLYFGWDKFLEHLFNVEIIKAKCVGNNDSGENQLNVEKFKEIVFSCFYRKAIPFSFTLPLLESLKENGYKVGLITNGKSRLQRKKLSMLGVENSFDEIIISGEFGKPKPDVSIFKEMSKRLSIPENELFYVGDNPICDIDASSKAGFHTIWVKTSGVWVDGCAKPDFEVETVEEIPEILNRLNKE